MARILVVADDLRTRVEITWSDEIGGWRAVCQCGDDLVAGTHEQFNLNDTVQAAELHADRHAAHVPGIPETEGPGQ